MFLELFKNLIIDRVIIFCNTKKSVQKLGGFLKANDIETTKLFFDMDHNSKTNIMKEFRDGTVKVIISTDITRGIHLQQVGLVINYDLKWDKVNYSRRVLRASGKNRGVAISLITELDSLFIKRLQDQYNIEINELPK